MIHAFCLDFCIFCYLFFHVFWSWLLLCLLVLVQVAVPLLPSLMLPVICSVCCLCVYLWSVFSCVDLDSEHVTVLIFSPAFFSPVTFCYLALDFYYKDFQPNFSLFVLWSCAVGSSHTSSLSLSLDPRIEKLR